MATVRGGDHLDWTSEDKVASDTFTIRIDSFAASEEDKGAHAALSVGLIRVVGGVALARGLVGGGREEEDADEGRGERSRRHATEARRIGVGVRGEARASRMESGVMNTADVEIDDVTMCAMGSGKRRDGLDREEGSWTLDFGVLLILSTFSAYFTLVIS